MAGSAVAMEKAEMHEEAWHACGDFEPPIDPSHVVMEKAQGWDSLEKVEATTL